MSNATDAPVKWLAVTKQDAELILDSLKCSNPISRPLVLKAASLVLEFAADDGVREAERLHQIDRAS